MSNNIEEDIKILEDYSYAMASISSATEKDIRVSKAIEKILADRERLEKENTDIKEVYIRTAKHLDKKGHLELSEYMLAQIKATPTFTTWEEYTTWVSKQVIRDKIEELNNMKVEGEVFTTAVNFAKKILQELLDTEK